MKRRLVSYDVFESIQNDSLFNVEKELTAAEPIIAKALEVEDVKLASFTTENAVYETIDGIFIKANYSINENEINFDNVEQLVIDTETEKKQARETISKMVHALIKNESSQAEQLFESYMSLPTTKRIFNEIKVTVSKSTGRGKNSPWKGKSRPGGHAAAMKAAKTRKRHEKMVGLGKKKQIAKLRAGASKGLRFQAGKGKKAIRSYVRIKEWANICENVLNFIDLKEYGPILNQTKSITDDNGNVTGLHIPTINAMKDAKLTTINWDNLNYDVVSARENAKGLNSDSEFCKSVAELKRHNALSDSAALEESLENIVSKWSDVIYLTEAELAQIIKLSLDSVSAKNFDDQTCSFMAEGILRTAHNAFVDRVGKIYKLANAEVDAKVEDKYSDFKKVSEAYYANLEDSNGKEMQAYVDLYEALRSAYEAATEDQNKDLVEEIANHLDALSQVINQQVHPDTEIAEDAALWLSVIVEANSEGMDADVFVTTTGDHSFVVKQAGMSYKPTDSNSKQAASDGTGEGAEDELEKKGLGNSKEDSFPSLSNPYVPKASKPEMVGAGEKDGEGLGDLSKETYPSLSNPFVPAKGMKKEDSVTEA